MPWLLIAVGAALLALIRPQSPNGATQSGSTSSPTVTSNQAQPSSPSWFVPPLGSIYPTNRPTAPVIGTVTRPVSEGPTEGQQTLGFVKQVVGYVKTAVYATMEALKAAGVAIGETVGQAVPIVSSVIGIGFGAAGIAEGSKDENLSESTSFISAVPAVGIVGLAISIPRLFEGIAAAQHDKKRAHDIKFQYTQAILDVKGWLPKAMQLSDRLDDWRLLPRITAEGRAKWMRETNVAAVSFLNTWITALIVDLDHIRYGETFGEKQVIPGRDTSQMEAIFQKGVTDGFILYLATRDYFARTGGGLGLPSLAPAWRSPLYAMAGEAGLNMTDYPGVIPLTPVHAHADEDTAAPRIAAIDQLGTLASTTYAESVAQGGSEADAVQVATLADAAAYQAFTSGGS